MDEDDRYWDLNANDAEYEPPRRSRLRGCVFLVVTLVVVLSLAGSSLAAWFVVTHRDAVEASARQAAGLASATEAPRLPTAAPATLVASVPTPAPTVSLAPTPDGPVVNRIAIVNADGQVETLAPGGGERRILTREGDETFFQFPTWSPDGRRLAVIGSTLTGGGIYVLPDETSSATLDERAIYFSSNETPFYLYWSPDSERLAFLANQSRNTMGLKIIAGDGASDSKLLATGTPFYWDWADDGRQLLVHSGQLRRGDLALIDIEGETQAGNLATPGAFQAPGIASGGRYWAFAEEAEAGLSALVVVDTQTGERRSYEQAGSLALSWSPTREQIAFTNGDAEGHPGWGTLHLLDVSTGQSRLLSRQRVLAFFWSPDGRAIAFVTISDDEDNGVVAQAPARRPTTARLASPAQQAQGMLSLSVVDVDTGQGLRLLDFEPTATYIAQFLPFFDQYALSHRIWSPDSDALVLPVRQESGNVVLIVPTRGGRPQYLADGDIAFWSQR